jgi:uroporphyrinogen decarboxylase
MEIHMTGKERVLRTLEFKNPDRIPVDAWILPGAFSKYGEKLNRLVEQYPSDLIQIAGPSDHGFNPEYYRRGTYTDLWGCPWINIQPGIIGEVKDHILSDDGRLDEYRAPTGRFLTWWEESKLKIDSDISVARKRGQFVLGGWISLFERMQFLRGTEELFIDIASKEGNTEKLLAIVMDFYRVYLDKWLEYDIDGVAFGDDWGSQNSTLIAPGDFRELFAPCYRELCAKIKNAGKKIFFHSDGWIFDLYDDILGFGVDAINTQVWCMGIEKVRAKLAGKVTVWGELNRQYTMPMGTPEDVRKEAQLLKDNFAAGGGGFIGLGTVLADVPFENAEAMFKAWNG